MLGYKIAKSLGKRVVIALEIPEDAITNVKRSNIVNAETAKYRTMKAKVIKIEDSDGKTYDEAISFNYDKNTLTYKLDEELVSHDFDMNLENVCAGGIHFFLTKHVAETYGLLSIENGVLTLWHENGVKQMEASFVNNKKHGLYCSWHENGVKQMEGTFENGKAQGIQYGWYENGKKCYEFPVLDNYKHGECHEWNRDGGQYTFTFTHGKSVDGRECCVIA
jgi:antitoxin component YwqK of YwqJK toxin-antitoxin module